VQTNSREEGGGGGMMLGPAVKQVVADKGASGQSKVNASPVQIMVVLVSEKLE